MKIISIGFKNPFHDSGYTNTIKINDLEDINVFIGKNNSGKTNILRSIYNLLHQDSIRSGIFRHIKVKLGNEDFQSIIEDFLEDILKMLRNRNKSDFETVPITRFYDEDITIQFYSLLNLMKDYPISKECFFILNFDNDIPNKKLIFDYTIENKYDLNEQVHKQIEDILKKVKSDQDLIKIIIKQILPFGKIILIPSFRTLEISEKKYRDEEIREITRSIEIILDSSFTKIPINAQRVEPFKIPNLALMLSIIKDKQMIGEYKEIMNPEFFDYFNSSLRKIFPDIDLYIDFKLTELTTKGGYKEFGRDMGDWTKLGHGTQQLISLLFLLLLPRDCVYIIDEPENGLHPGLQSKLLSFIKEIVLINEDYSKQFLFGTHSTCFIDFKGNYSHFLLKKDEKDFNVNSLDKSHLDFLREELEFTPSALLQPNGVIWVEGPSDVYYVKAIFKCFNLDLEEERILIAPYNGKSMIEKGHITTDFLREVNSNFVFIIDSDFKNKNQQMGKRLLDFINELKQLEKKYWIIEKCRDIEGIIPQKILNDYFKIKEPFKNFKWAFKKPYQKLETYVKRIKTWKLTEPDSPKFDKVKTAKGLSRLINNSVEYQDEIRKNQYIFKNVKNFLEEIKIWRGRPLILNIESNDKSEEIFKIPSNEIMRDKLVQFSTSKIPEKMLEISNEFISWGGLGIEFLLEEHRTNKYGYSNISGTIMDMSYSDWREQSDFKIGDPNIPQPYYCDNCNSLTSLYPGTNFCIKCGHKIL